MGHHSLNHQWGMHRRSLFLPTLPWAKEDSIGHRVLHKHLLFGRWTIWVGAWVEVEDRAHKPRLQGIDSVRKHRVEEFHGTSMEESHKAKFCLEKLERALDDYMGLLRHRV